MTSIFRYYVYFHMRRFLRNPRLMTEWLTESDLHTIQQNIPFLKVWTWKSKYTKETFGVFLKEKRAQGKKLEVGVIMVRDMVVWWELNTRR